MSQEAKDNKRTEKVQAAEAKARFAGRVDSALTGLLALFMLAILVVFPVYYHDYYWDIMEAKYRFYWVAAVALLVVCLVICLVWLAGMKHFGDSKAIAEGIVGFLFPEEDNRSGVLRQLLIFWVVCGLSTIFSEYVYESFWGNEGRYSGLFLISLYAATTVLIAKFGKIRREMMELFLLPCAFVAFFGITDFFEVDLLGFRGVAEGVEELGHFVSTIGNVNTYTAFLALSAAVSAVFFMQEEKPLRIVWYFLLTFLTFTAMAFGQSENIFFSLPALFIYLPFYGLKRRDGFYKYILLIAALLTGMWIAGYYKKLLWADALAISWAIWKIYLTGLLGPAAVLMWVLGGGLLWHFLRGRRNGEELFLPEEKTRRYTRIWMTIVAAGILAVVGIMLVINLMPDKSFLGTMSDYFLLDDDWGSQRGYSWRVGLEAWRELTPVHKVLGHGPDTYGILTWAYREEALDLYGFYFESAHNEFLQYFVTIGPIGTLAYVLFLCGAFRLIHKRSKDIPWLMAPAAAILCYNAQAIVNINLPIATPIMWLMIGIGLAGCRDDWKLPLPGWFRKKEETR